MLTNLLKQTFGRLSVTCPSKRRKTPSGQFKTRWTCKCECGNITTVDSQALTSGRTKSCGCLASDEARIRNRKHGMTGTKEYRAWTHAKGRCYDTNDPKYPIYGGAGIGMDDEWRGSFEAFFRDMGLAPKGFTLERKNGKKDYCKENCEWATRKTQANNCCTNRIVIFNGVEMTLAQCADVANKNYKSLWHYLKKLGNLKDAIESCSPRGLKRSRMQRLYC